MNFNLQTIKSIIESNGIEVGFVNKPIVKDIDGNEYSLKSRMFDYEKDWVDDLNDNIIDTIKCDPTKKILILGINSYLVTKPLEEEFYMKVMRFTYVNKNIGFDKDEVFDEIIEEINE